MSKDPIPWFKFYPDKFMHGVRGLTAQEVGVYQMMLCRIYEENGPVEYHVLRLSTYCGMRQNTFKKTVEKLIDLGKLTLKDGYISNDRADTEISSRANDLKISSRGGKVSAEKRQQNQRKSSSECQAKVDHKDKEEDIKELSKDSPKKGSRGSCLPDDWQPSNDFIDWPVQNLNWTINRSQAEAAKFKDYWIAKTGANATKKDWLATWRNWCRNARPPGPDQIQRQETATQKLKREAQERWNLSTEGKHHDQSPGNPSGPLRLVASSSE